MQGLLMADHGVCNHDGIQPALLMMNSLMGSQAKCKTSKNTQLPECASSSLFILSTSFVY